MPGVSKEEAKVLLKRINKASDFIRGKTTLNPKSAVILGTGLGLFTEEMEIDVSIDYEDIPGFPISTVVEHAGVMHIGKLFIPHLRDKTPSDKGQSVDTVVLDGRFHLYEGYEPVDIATPIRVLKTMGIESLIITNASGGLNPFFKAGELMVIKDHINFTGQDPLIGENLDEIGPRFPDMSRAYDKGLIEMAEGEAKRLGITLNRGVYIGIRGPSLETPAETRMLRLLGGDATGMSTVLEVISAVHAGLRVLGLSVISNVNLPDAMEPILIDDIIENARGAGPDLIKIIKGVLLMLNERTES